MQVWRFDDGVMRTHIMARSQEEATEIFERADGRDFQDEDSECELEIYPIDGGTELPISFDGGIDFETRTADEWIAHYKNVPAFL